MTDDPSAEAPSLSEVRHALRTPLNQIIGYSEMLEEEAHDLGQPTFVETLRKIASAGRGLSALLEEAFGVSRRTTRDAAPEPLPAEAPEDTPDAAAPREGRLLVVDDNEMNRDLLSRRLSARGYTVGLARDGAEALEMIDAEPFDLVLLDVMMPGLSGFVAESHVFLGGFFGNEWHSVQATRILTVIATMSVVVTAVYVLRGLARVFHGPIENVEFTKLGDAVLSERLSTGILVAMLALLGMLPWLFNHLIEGSVLAIVNRLAPTGFAVVP